MAPGNRGRVASLGAAYRHQLAAAVATFAAETLNEGALDDLELLARPPLHPESVRAVQQRILDLVEKHDPGLLTECGRLALLTGPPPHPESAAPVQRRILDLVEKHDPWLPIVYGWQTFCSVIHGRKPSGRKFVDDLPALVEMAHLRLTGRAKSVSGAAEEALRLRFVAPGRQRATDIRRLRLKYSREPEVWERLARTRDVFYRHLSSELQAAGLLDWSLGEGESVTAAQMLAIHQAWPRSERQRTLPNT